ncbi:hypothetical protein BGW36DRAFT_360302 [Talaromyces proteolyticus]|uniref:Uncharacterized protein n=1 Tax=Talaromyces proteolyticus TaxID=1131652 RepID=A0AAD4KQ44_9EURO|nr:uncharacterized protein BGW36DRAFT_360302 [Talaromyces proteolyticus]KAH8696468.1 hypothetical protein BGW36DRAFT_360302 [Talaromyces proteolyticus]
MVGAMDWIDSDSSFYDVRVARSMTSDLFLEIPRNGSWEQVSNVIVYYNSRVYVLSVRSMGEYDCGKAKRSDIVRTLRIEAHPVDLVRQPQYNTGRRIATMLRSLASSPEDPEHSRSWDTPRKSTENATLARMFSVASQISEQNPEPS